MSLEAALAETTAALHTVAELLKQSNAGRDAAVAALSGKEGAPAPTAATATSAAAEEPKRRGRPPGSAKTAEPATPKIPTIDDLRKAAGDFMETTDTAVREKRKEFVKGMIDHFGVTKVVEIAEADRQQAIAWLAAKGRGETVNFGAEEDEPAGEDDFLG